MIGPERAAADLLPLSDRESELGSFPPAVRRHLPPLDDDTDRTQHALMLVQCRVATDHDANAPRLVGSLQDSLQQRTHPYRLQFHVVLR